MAWRRLVSTRNGYDTADTAATDSKFQTDTPPGGIAPTTPGMTDRVREIIARNGQGPLAVAAAIPLLLGLLPRLPRPGALIEIVAGVVIGPSVLGSHPAFRWR